MSTDSYLLPPPYPRAIYATDICATDICACFEERKEDINITYDQCLI